MGLKEVLRAIKEGKTCEIFLASDVEKKIEEQVLKTCGETKVSVTQVSNMKQLGKAAGINVGAAVVAIDIDCKG
ncbi:MAG: ribosomal L7Ae/L30e/S12e/Gadd45 family protein, partial [Clostridiales bacterium]|nr:ribosomal L7Ae/L30e/S12e/Gadd45 family protein [Clostridiales bacterium]